MFYTSVNVIYLICLLDHLRLLDVSWYPEYVCVFAQYNK